MSADIHVADALAYRVGRSPIVYVAIMSSDATGIAAPSLIAKVQAELDRPENRMVNGDVVVRSAVTSVVNISARLVLTPGSPEAIIAVAEKALRDAWVIEGGLGRDLTLGWIKARLQVAGVYSVAIDQPAQDEIKPPYEAASIGTVTIQIIGEDE